MLRLVSSPTAKIDSPRTTVHGADSLLFVFRVVCALVFQSSTLCKHLLISATHQHVSITEGRSSHQGPVRRPAHISLCIRTPLILPSITISHVVVFCALSLGFFLAGRRSDSPTCSSAKSYCPYCKSAKQLLSSLDVEDVYIRELDLEDDGSEVQDYLEKSTGQVPCSRGAENRQLIDE